MLNIFFALSYLQKADYKQNKTIKSYLFWDASDDTTNGNKLLLLSYSLLACSFVQQCFFCLSLNGLGLGWTSQARGARLLHGLFHNTWNWLVSNQIGMCSCVTLIYPPDPGGANIYLLEENNHSPS